VNRTIKIGTRDSELARWQANQVKDRLADHGYQSELVLIKSEGDLDLSTPLYELGVTGIFTKTLDIALLSGKIDIAVHSLKDVPTQLPKGIVQTAVLPRASAHDLLVVGMAGFNDREHNTIATGSLRRKAQWLHRYPEDTVVGLRGNVNTRLKKLDDSNWNGAVFARAGLERIGLLPDRSIELDWMIPAPAQGAMAVVARQNDAFSRECTTLLNDTDTELCTRIERVFLRELEGGCSAPIGALAVKDQDTIVFKGVLLSLDGRERIFIERSYPVGEAELAGKQCAADILGRGGSALMEQIRNSN
jgi:hydroxymethylbilane synthase